MIDIKPRRSVLYLPAANVRAIEKARTLACDAVILDLEDAVAPEMKAEARRQAVTAVRDGGFGRRELVIRINGQDTPWYEEDLAAVRSARPDAVLLPKVNGPGDIAACARGLDGDTPVWAMIETARCLFQLEAIAATAQTDRLTCFIMGTNDLVKELRATFLSGRANILSFLMTAVAAARAHGIAVVDGVYNAFEDDEGFLAECHQGASMGFDGKTLIHPRQIDPCNQAFSPTEQELAWARKIVAAFADPGNANSGAIRIDGKMVELLHLAQARYTIALAEATKSADPVAPAVPG
ncbi:CoA ester lyase [Sphingobium sp. EM0848]|uniref:HpcH/HpaI aldolase/citrate lyase family protein n=1 Tax=Sphingobium sp. EM0848 TaxID=2743473 RepID=UPI00350F201C